VKEIREIYPLFLSLTYHSNQALNDPDRLNPGNQIPGRSSRSPDPFPMQMAAEAFSVFEDTGPAFI
jgi:hypothetical protein